MSLIGPRPERPEIENEFLKEIPYYNYRYILRPGITGWAQINGDNNISWKRKFNLDLWYVKNFNIFIFYRRLPLCKANFTK